MKTWNLLCISISTLFISSFLVGCASYDSRLNHRSTAYLGGNTQSQEPSYLPESRAYWDGDNVSGSPSIVLNLTRQAMYYYKGGHLVGMSPVSTGREGLNTPAGNFRVIQKDKHHISNQCGNFVDPTGKIIVADVNPKNPRPPGTSFRGDPMPFFMRLHGGVGIHAGFLPGIPDSHGCIRMPEKVAAIFFHHTPLGTPVKITY